MVMLRPRSVLPTLVLPLALVPACTEHAPSYYNLTDEAPNTTETTGTTAESPAEPMSTASTESAEPTSTSSADVETTSVEASSGSFDFPPNAPPEIFSFACSPDQIGEPGPVQLELAVSADVVEVDLWHGGDLLGTYAAADFPVTFDVTSQNTCQGPQKFTATVRDAEGLTAESPPAELFCQLPAPGSEDYTRQLEGTSSALGSAVAQMADGGVVVAGSLDDRMLVWRLDATGTPIANSVAEMFSTRSRELPKITKGSGNLPMSSAEIASTIESAFFLTEMASSMPLRIPVTTTVSCASATSAKPTSNTAQPAATGRNLKPWRRPAACSPVAMIFFMSNSSCP